MQTIPDTSPAVYVSTYKKYNEGKLNGVWVSLNKFKSKGDFIDYCNNVLFQDEDYPELMYQDWEFINENQITESHLDESLFEDSLPDWLSDYEKEIVEAYHRDIDPSGEPQNILDRYIAQYDSKREYVDECIENSEVKLPYWLTVDYESTYENNLRFDVDVTNDLHFFQH